MFQGSGHDQSEQETQKICNRMFDVFYICCNSGREEMYKRNYILLLHMQCAFVHQAKRQSKVLLLSAVAPCKKSNTGIDSQKSYSKEKKVTIIN